MCSLPSSPNEGPVLPVPFRREGIDIPSHLVEEFHQRYGVGRRASSVIETREVSNVIFVVGRVEVLAVPASGHVYTSLESSFTVGVWPASI